MSAEKGSFQQTISSSKHWFSGDRIVFLGSKSASGILMLELAYNTLIREVQDMLSSTTWMWRCPSLLGDPNERAGRFEYDYTALCHNDIDIMENITFITYPDLTESYINMPCVMSDILYHIISLYSIVDYILLYYHVTSLLIMTYHDTISYTFFFFRLRLLP